MKRFVVFVLLVALPIRTVIAVSRFGCAMMPMAKSQAESSGNPCPAHIVESLAVETGAAGDDGNTSCASCVLACCAALAPEPVEVVAVAQIGSFVAVAMKTLFASAVPHVLERPPRLA